MLHPATYEEAAQGSDPGSVSDHSRRHHRFLLQRLQSTLSIRHMNDATFVVEGGEVVASRLVLAAASEYFRALLVGEDEEFRERAAGAPIEIYDIDKPTFEVCVQYLYGGAPELTRANVMQVLKAADMLQIEPLCSACAEAMATMVDASTCFPFLAASEVYPKLLGDVRTGCLAYVDQSLDALFCHDAEAQGAVNALSLGTMLQVCSHVGLGLAGAAAPAAGRLQAILDAVVAWGRAHFGPSVGTPQDLYDEMQAMEFGELAERSGASERFVHVFAVTQGQLATCEILKSDVRTLSGYSFRTCLYSNDRGSSHFGAYLMTPARTAYPDWWQCAVVYQFRSDLGSGTFWGRPMFSADESLDLGTGFPKFLPHAEIPDVPGAVGALASGDVRASIELTAELVLDSITSLLAAYSFFHHNLWAGLRTGHLRGILRSDALPVSSEDALLGRLLSLGRGAEELDELLRHVRWQFLTPAFLLDACRDPECSAFRSCACTKAALHWYFGRREMPEGARRSRRASYDEGVQDQHGAGSEGALVDFLLGRVASPCWPPAPGGEAPEDAAP